jgi:CheY-like chemotaxis protein
MSRWLLVEDEEDIYLILSHFYKLFDASPLLFTNGEDAMAWLDAVDAGEITSDLPVFALIDIRLSPDLDPNALTGIDVGERIRRCAPIRHIPIVLMTAYLLSPQEKRRAMARTRANLFIEKPLPAFAELRKLLLDLVK